MTRYALSVLIPARNEYYLDIDLLHETVVNVLANTSKQTQLVVVLDGYTDSWPKRPLPANDRLTIIHHRQSIGQRAATNEAARVATGEYVCKLDAHCALDENFDEKLLATFEPHWTVVPAQYNLLAFNWRCQQCGNLQDQGPQPDRCKQCRGRRWQQQKLWIPRDGREGSNGAGGKRNSLTHSWRFDSQLNFQYWGGYAADERHTKKHNLQFRPETQQPIHDTMSLLGACWAIRRERYFELDICDEQMGSWGQQGTEVACKTWLSGGELKVNMSTWFAHFFRVGGLGFPYPDGGRKERAVARSKELWLKNQWPKQTRPLSWLIEKFQPVPDWGPENPVTKQVTKAGEEFRRRQGEAVPEAPVVVQSKPRTGCLYYTCNSHDETLELACRNNLKQAVNGYEVGTVALRRTDFGDWTIVLDQPKGPLTMHQQILAGLERSTADYVFFCENDVLYHPSHFEFVPPRDDTYYYNTNVWRVRYRDGHAIRTADCKQLSGLCASRKLLLEHYRRRVERISTEGFSRKNGYEPGTRHLPNGYDDYPAASWSSAFPNLDIKDHGATVTKGQWTPDDFRNKKYTEGWQESTGRIEPWPLFYGRVQEWLKELADG